MRIPSVMNGALAAALLLSACAGTPTPSTGPQPVIDMHVHVGPGSANSRIYQLMPGETPDAARLRFTLAEMKANGVVFAMVTGAPSHTGRFLDAQPGRFLAGYSLPCTNGLDPHIDPCVGEPVGFPDPALLREQVESGRLGAIGELLNVYAGVSPADPRMQPYFELAAEYDLIVAVHAGRGPPPQGRPPGCCPDFDGEFGHPAVYRDLLKRHPKLRLYLMHVVQPDFVQAAIALMREYPNVYMDTSPMSLIPEEMAHAAMRQVVDAGFGERIMFGSDYLGQVAHCIGVVESATFLSPQQKRAIFHDNAARFLRRDSSDDMPL